MLNLSIVWASQVEYNKRVRAIENPEDFEYWMKQYLLGAISEVDEILQEINWKSHRRGHPMNLDNLARELADLTKYVFCMWEWSGFTSDQMLAHIQAKSLELEERFTQDFERHLPHSAPVVISDIDGTLGDYRAAFYQWLIDTHNTDLPIDLASNLAIEVDLAIPYSQYEKYKAEFEATGGYGLLPIYADAAILLEELAQREVAVILFTARPAQHYSRIWSDTWQWLKQCATTACVSELHIGASKRISRACTLVGKGHPVVLLEDDPTLALRAAHAGVTVLLRNQPYNQGITHPNIHRFDRFTADEVMVYLQGEDDDG